MIQEMLSYSNVKKSKNEQKMSYFMLLGGGSLLKLLGNQS